MLTRPGLCPGRLEAQRAVGSAKPVAVLRDSPGPVLGPISPGFIRMKTLGGAERFPARLAVGRINPRR